jgi:hypothetical protein
MNKDKFHSILFLANQIKVIVVAVLIVSVFLSQLNVRAVDNGTDIYINYIKKSVLPSGAIARYPKEIPLTNEIVPYWSNLAICGLATEIKFGNADNKAELTKIATNALDWYKSNQNQTTGIVYDYEVRGSQEVSKGTMDSVDSYSASFLMALACMRRAVPEFKSSLPNYKSAIALAIRSIYNIQDRDGLTFAKPNYNIKYLMDNIEVWSGLSSINPILVELKDTRNLYLSRYINQRLQIAITKKLWDPVTNTYKWAVSSTPGTPDVISTTNWNVYYPDALENIWPGIFGFKEPFERSVALATKFSNYTYSDNGIATGDWNPFVGVAYFNSRLRANSQSSFDYTYKQLSENKLGGLYTSGHAGVSLILYHKLNRNTSILW